MVRDFESRSPVGHENVLCKLRQRLKEKEKALEVGIDAVKFWPKAIDFWYFSIHSQQALDEKFAAIEEKDNVIHQLQLSLRERERDLDRLNNLISHNEETINVSSFYPVIAIINKVFSIECWDFKDWTRFNLCRVLIVSSKRRIWNCSILQTHWRTCREPSKMLKIIWTDHWERKTPLSASCSSPWKERQKTWRSFIKKASPQSLHCRFNNYCFLFWTIYVNIYSLDAKMF